MEGFIKTIKKRKGKYGKYFIAEEGSINIKGKKFTDKYSLSYLSEIIN